MLGQIGVGERDAADAIDDGVVMLGLQIGRQRRGGAFAIPTAEGLPGE